jgi:hypothetical protein
MEYVPDMEGSLSSGLSSGTEDAIGAHSAGMTPYAENGTAGFEIGAEGTATTPSFAPTALAGVAGSFLGGKIAQPIGEKLGVGGQSERGFVGKVGGGALATTAMGAGPIPGAAIGLADWGMNEGGGAIRSGWNSTVGQIPGLDTWVCTAVQNSVGLDDEDKKALFNLRKYCLRNHAGWLHWYLDEGKKIVDGIERAYTPEELETIYDTLKRVFVLPVTSLVKSGDMEDAYNYYLTFATELCKFYAPEVEIREHVLVEEVNHAA